MLRGAKNMIKTPRASVTVSKLYHRSGPKNRVNKKAAFRPVSMHAVEVALQKPPKLVIYA